jgi:hypothetical protein
MFASCAPPPFAAVPDQPDHDNPPPPPQSWWLASPADFAARCAAFNVMRRTLGERDIPPAVRDYLLDAETVQHLADSGIAAKKRR